ncbi:hypothetical protein Hanom_Chr17g01580171 [Helianthus anomalus]
MLQELRAELRTSQTVATELRCRVTVVERKLLEEKYARAVLEQRERAWERERATWAEEKEELCFTQGFGSFLAIVSQSEEFKGSLERIYRAYRDVGYQTSLKDGYAYSTQGLGRKETPFYNSKAKKQLSKMNKEFGEKTPALLEKILERPLISIDELKALLTPAGPSSPKSLSGDASPCRDPLLVAQDLFVFIPFPWIICLLSRPAGA